MASLISPAEQMLRNRHAARGAEVADGDEPARGHDVFDHGARNDLLRKPGFRSENIAANCCEEGFDGVFHGAKLNVLRSVVNTQSVVSGRFPAWV